MGISQFGVGILVTDDRAFDEHSQLLDLNSGAALSIVLLGPVYLGSIKYWSQACLTVTILSIT